MPTQRGCYAKYAGMPATVQTCPDLWCMPKQTVLQLMIHAG